MESRSHYWITFGLLIFSAGIIFIYLALRPPAISVKSDIQFSVKSGQRGPDGTSILFTYKIPGTLKFRDGDSLAENSIQHVQLLIKLSQATRHSLANPSAEIESAKSTFFCDDFDVTLTSTTVHTDKEGKFLTKQENGDCLFQWYARENGTGQFQLTPHVKHPLVSDIQNLQDLEFTVHAGFVDRLQRSFGPVVSLLGILSTLKGLASSKRNSGKKRTAK